MRFEVLRGLNQIGGNIIEVEGKDTRILLDAGAELPGTPQERKHSVDFDALVHERDYDAIFITHYHGDHLGLLEEPLSNLPPIYMGELSYRLYSVSCGYRKTVVPFALSGHLKDGVPIRVGDLTVTPIFCDHSAADSYSLVVTDGNDTLLYTGDFRSNGRKSFESYLGKLPACVDDLIIEGTTVNREEVRNPGERDLEESMVEALRECRNQVFVLMSALNIDRVTTVYRAATRSDRLMLMDPYMAAIATECAEYGIRIPSPSLGNVGVYLHKGVDRDEHDRLRKLYAESLVGRSQYGDRPYAMCVRASASMLKHLEKLDAMGSLDRSTLIYSLWEGYRQTPSMARFLSGVEALGIRVIPMHTSGHADAEAIRAVLERTRPKRLTPIHTENPEWFERNFPEAYKAKE